jgi:hypothetical protein
MFPRNTGKLMPGYISPNSKNMLLSSNPATNDDSLFPSLAFLTVEMYLEPRWKVLVLILPQRVQDRMHNISPTWIRSCSACSVLLKIMLVCPS